MSASTTTRCCALALLAGWQQGAAGQTLHAQHPLNFGTFAVTGSGTVSISAAGARSATGGVLLVARDPGAPATFSVNNMSNTTRVCGALSLQRTGGLIRRDDIVAIASPAVGTVGPQQSVQVAMGATLSVTANQAPAVYTDANAVSVSINCEK